MATGAAIVAPVTTTAIAVGGAVISAITDKEEKIEISKIQLTQLQETAPEFYRENKDLLVINDTANTKTSDVLSMAKDFYSNAKTPDEQLSNLVGNVVGGAVVGKAISRATNTSVKIGEEFGKLGTYIGDEYPELKVDWSVTSNHALERMEKRGISKLDVEHYISNGKVLKQARGQYAFISEKGVAILNEKNILITTYPSKYYDETMKEIVNKLFGK